MKNAPTTVSFSFGDSLIFVDISYKRSHCISIRRKKEDDRYSMTLPWFAKAWTLKQVESAALEMVSKSKKLEERRQKRYKGDKNWSKDFYYLLGVKKETGFASEEEAELALKKIALPFFESRVRYYEKKMSILEPYHVRVRNMSTRYGVNSSKTHTITFTTFLICYSPEIIDAVVVHELAHHYVHNHQKEFYDLVLKYYPNYRECHGKLRKEIHC